MVSTDSSRPDPPDYQQEEGESPWDGIGPDSTNCVRRHPSWLPTDMCHLKGSAVGPTDAAASLVTGTNNNNDNEDGPHGTILANARLVETELEPVVSAHVLEQQQSTPCSTCVPDTNTVGGRRLLCAIVVIAVALSAVAITGILCASGVCTSKEEDPPITSFTTEQGTFAASSSPSVVFQESIRPLLVVTTLLLLVCG
ncbi:expressed unknown protein [Seminavis robusta]|uniref:Uncharacterized protein n=1 Tax=Seminavis robusta TaxID=568900 RepID=A0A9N8HFG9_9STRA|nr:expressed unknown protein [Seminavis robusta]|eukprot:Sro455_g146500.1 n/a (198) ;mRNA; f:26346-26939